MLQISNDFELLLFFYAFKNLETKKIFNSKILTEKEQLDLMNEINKIEIYKGNLKDSDISFMIKK